MAERQSGPPTSVILIAIVSIVVLVLGWHMFVPAVGLLFSFTDTLWSMMIASVSILIITIILFFAFSALGIFVLSAVAVIWSIIAIILFPILFPLLAPIVILLILLGIFLGQR